LAINPPNHTTVFHELPAAPDRFYPGLTKVSFLSLSHR
jgi:hypothetical protein